MGRLFASLAATLKPKGMQVGFHNHTVEMEVFDGRTGFEWFAESAGPDVIVTLDIAWAARGGQDPRRSSAGSRDTSGTSTSRTTRRRVRLPTSAASPSPARGPWTGIASSQQPRTPASSFTLEHDMPKDAALVLKEGNAFLTARLGALLSR